MADVKEQAAREAVALDLLFLLDATGSMADEIHQLKVTIDEVAQRIYRLPGDVDVRLGMTLYRDEFDSFLTATFDLTPDVDAFDEALTAVVADGGDDHPETLAEALSQPSWRPAEETVQGSRATTPTAARTSAVSEARKPPAAAPERP